MDKFFAGVGVGFLFCFIFVASVLGTNRREQHTPEGIEKGRKFHMKLIGMNEIGILMINILSLGHDCRNKKRKIGEGHWLIVGPDTKNLSIR